MTNNQLTREWLIKKAQEQIAFCRDTKITGEGRAHVDQCAALFEIALAAMDSEPVMYCMEGNGLDPEAVSTRREVVEAWVNEWNTEDRSPGEPIYSTVPLYRHAQQPVVQCPFPCGWDNLNKLAIQDAAFIACGLVEGEPITEAHRQAAISNNDRLLKVISACRAAMLQAGNHAEDRCMLHVWTNPDFNAESSRGQSDIFNANGWHARFYEQNKPTKFPYDYNPGNSPVIPDRWIPVSERMPEKGQAVLVYRPKAHEGGDSDVRVAVYGRHNFEHGFGCYWEPSHWMPLPNSPQEAK
ncbi:TPA: DUF551 domain-containing protein [Klebsiella michiganensis]|nr:DUF551 domain-containing protein [Klebsiella michiganensis]